MKLFAAIASFVGGLVALTATGASWLSWIDEAETPESLIK